MWIIEIKNNPDDFIKNFYSIKVKRVKIRNYV